MRSIKRGVVKSDVPHVQRVFSFCVIMADFKNTWVHDRKMYSLPHYCVNVIVFSWMRESIPHLSLSTTRYQPTELAVPARNIVICQFAVEEAACYITSGQQIQMKTTKVSFASKIE